jgi:hypothetical protein
MLFEALMGPVLVEVPRVGIEDGPGVLFVVDQDVVGALAADTADESFGVAVGPRSQLHRMRTIGSGVSG